MVKKENKNQKLMREKNERRERESTGATGPETSEETPSGQPESSSAAQQRATPCKIFDPLKKEVPDPKNEKEVKAVEAHSNGLWKEIASIKKDKAILCTPGESPTQSITDKEDRNVRDNKNVDETALSLRKHITNIPLRTGYGAMPPLPGYPVMGHHLLANYFHLEVNSKKTIHEYSVSFVEKIKRKRRRLFALLLRNPDFLDLVVARNPDRVAADYNSTIYTTEELKHGDHHVLKIEYKEVEEVGPRANPQIYDITIAPVGKIDMQSLVTYLEGRLTPETADYNEALATRALNTILAKTPNQTTSVYTTGENKFYLYPDADKCLTDCEDKDAGCMTLGQGLIAVRGYYASVRTSTQRLLVNLHTQSSAFYAAVNVYDIMRFNKFDSTKLEILLRKLRVRTCYMKEKNGNEEVTVEKVKTVIGLSEFCPSQTMFTSEDGAQISVETFFRQRYGRILQKADEGFCLKVGEITKDKDGKELPEHKRTPIWLPPELCDVMPGQVYPKKLDSDQTKRMVAYAARPPQENVSRLLDQGLKILGLHSSQQNRILPAFGLNFKPELIAVPARILKPLDLRYEKGKDGKQSTKLGTWNLIGRTFCNPKPMPKWCFLLVQEGRRSELDNTFSPIFHEALGSYGLGRQTAQPLRRLDWYDKNRDRSDQDLKHVLTEAWDEGIRFVIVILQSTKADVFSRIKFWADYKIGIHTVCCVRAKTIKPANKSDTRAVTCANLALKINAKLGGTNHKYEGTNLESLSNTMIVGIDVTHPSSNSLKRMPSIAGVVANYDQLFSQWPGSIRCQDQKNVPLGSETWKSQEMVQELTEMMAERLRLYEEKRGRLPENILVYRDGVSESQYEQVLNEELPKIKDACTEVGKKKYLPKITIVVVGKRHHTRFYATKSDHADNNLKNPRAGTVVDRGVTMLHGYDFFLQPHAALTGTAKPGHYIVIKNDMLLTAPQFETITNTLCYLYVRATMAVSVCPPAYYADLLCERGRCYLWEDFNMGFRTPDKVWKMNKAEWFKGVHEK